MLFLPVGINPVVNQWNYTLINFSDCYICGVPAYVFKMLSRWKASIREVDLACTYKCWSSNFEVYIFLSLKGSLLKFVYAEFFRVSLTLARHVASENAIISWLFIERTFTIKRPVLTKKVWSDHNQRFSYPDLYSTDCTTNKVQKVGCLSVL